MKNWMKPSLIALASFALLSSCASKGISSAKSESMTSSSSSSSSLAPSLAQYTVQFLNADGTVLQKSSWKEGVLPIYNGDTPTKVMDATTFYSFSGWTPEIVPAHSDATYTATYESHDIAQESLKNLEFTYDSSSSGYEIRGNNDELGLPALIIPSSYDDGTNGSHPVSAILSNAFWGWENLEWVKLPTSLRTIHDAAFGYCLALKELDIPEGVLTLEQYAFTECLALEKVSFPSTLQEVGMALVKGDTALTTISVASGNPTFTSDGRALIQEGTILVAYANGSGKEYTVKEGITTIGTMAIAGSDTLETLALPSSLTSMSFLEGCTALKKMSIAEGNANFTTDSRSIVDVQDKALIAYANASGSDYVIPEGIVKLETEAFAKAVSLVSVSLPSSLTTIEINAFAHCSALKSLVIPSMVSTVGSGACLACDSLESVVLSSKMTKICAACFANCSKLNNVILPASITEIEQNGFNSCQDLTNLSFAGTMSAWGQVKKGSYWREGSPFTSVTCSDGSSTVLD